jgi:hypothetical protein
MRVQSHDHRAAARRRSLWARSASGAAIAVLLATGVASAQSVKFEGNTFVNQGLVGVARVPSNARDQFGDTMGGIGSAMAMDLQRWRQGRDGSYSGTLYMLPDKGWNTQGTVDFAGRLHRFEVKLNPFYGTSTTAQNQLTLDYKSSVMFRELTGTPTTGLDATAVRPQNFRFPDMPIDSKNHIVVDDEGVVLPGDGTMWVSDEYGPYVYHYAANGTLLDVIRPPAAFIPMRKNASGKAVENFSADAPPIGVTYNPDPGNPVSGRQNNQGFEGLAISPDGNTLFVLLQSALIQDLDPANIKTTRRNTRLLAYDLKHDKKLVGEYAVQLPLYQDQTKTTPSLLIAAQSELHALNDHQFLVLARDSSVGMTYPATPGSVYRSIDLIDISKATNIANTKYDQPENPIAPLGVLNPAIKPVAYQSFLNINDNKQLNRLGLHNGAPNNSNDLYEKWESIAVVPVGDKKAPHDYFLFVGSDNDFITQDGVMQGKPYKDASGYNVDSLVLVYRVTLPTYIAPGDVKSADGNRDDGNRDDHRDNDHRDDRH